MPASLLNRRIGSTPVSTIGLGTAYYGASEPDEQRFKVLDAAYEEGCTLWDTADVCGDSEEFIGRWFQRTGKRNEIFLATKFGPLHSSSIADPDDCVKTAFEKTKQRLGVDIIDLYYFHAADEDLPIELIVGAMAELVKDGKVKYLGLCGVSASDLRRAHGIHPIAALKVEYSPFILDIEDEKNGLLKTCRELGVAVVAYSPLGRGVMKGKTRPPVDFNGKDSRCFVSRHSEENIQNVCKLAEMLKAIGEKHGATAAQVTLAWLLEQGKDIIPLPGTRRIKYLKENINSTLIKLSSEEIREVRDMAEKVDAANGLDCLPND